MFIEKNKKTSINKILIKNKLKKKTSFISQPVSVGIGLENQFLCELFTYHYTTVIDCLLGTILHNVIMAQLAPVCEIEDGVKERIKKFRFRKAKNNAAVMLKVDNVSRTVVVEDEFEDCTVDELREELPASQPRYIVLSYVYHHDDGRTSYPLIFIFVSPQGCKPEQQMLYAGSVTSLTKELEMTKIFDVRNTDELTEEWIMEKLRFF